MLMEPDEYTPQERALTDKAKELIEQHELDWGNGECFIQCYAGRSELYMTLEAPNHATVSVTVPAETDEKGLRRAMADGSAMLNESAGELRDRSIEEGWEIIDAMVDDGRLARKDEGEEAETSETYDPANPADSLSIADPSASAAATR
ncbi:MAG: hypothetical protein AYW83_02920 [Bifidobacterium breve]|nr:MAG: hypothetical protein AYW83_02920 [Bifidobacterium breve]